MNVKMRDVVNAAAALKKLADNATLPPDLFLLVANAWRDVMEQLEHYQRAVRALEGNTTHSVKRNDPQTGEPMTIMEFIDFEARRRYLAGLDSLHDTEIDLPRVRTKIKYDRFITADTGLTPAEFASLFWLIETSNEE